MTPATMILEDGSRITVMHLAVTVQPDGLALASERHWCIACAPNVRDLTAANRPAPVLRTDDPRLVNCPMCKKSAAYKTAMDEIRNARRIKR